MTLQYAIEEVLDHFPALGSTIITSELNKAYRRFCALSRVYRSSYNLTLTTAVSYSLASDVDMVYRVDFKDSTGKVLEETDNPTYVIEHGSITFYTYLGEKLSSIPSNITTIILHYNKIPTALSTLSSSFAIEDEFHEYIVFGALAKLYARYPVQVATQQGMASGKDWNAVKYYQNEFITGIREAIRKGNKGKDGTPYQIAINEL